MLTAISSQKSKNQSHLTKDEMKQLMNLAESESERDRLRYAVVKSSGISSTAAKNVFGFSGMNDKKANVEKAMEEATAIKNAIENIAMSKEKVLLQSLGINEE